MSESNPTSEALTPRPLLEGLDVAAFHETLRNARQRLLDERNEHGWWTGELSSSALSTATAIVAMELARRNGSEAAKEVGPLIERGVCWLIAKQNEDGGWGDTDKSKSNISTTMLVWAAMGLWEKSEKAIKRESEKSEDGIDGRTVLAGIQRCETWLKNHAGSLEISALVEAVMKRYGKDRTFSVPILTMCALCGRLGPVEDRATWKWVKQLPFEFAAFPRSWFKVLNLQVVSYALPALIAIGLVRHHHRASWNPFARLARWLTKSRVLRLLETIQPPNGGFLEATPLTSFVSMSLAACGFARGPVVTRGIDFIIKSMRPDGSWPIDTNLATWVTTLSVNALAAGGKLHDHLNENERGVIRDWILKQQYKEVHPYTGAAPGGWAWTDLPGGVPDADDTSGAVIALSNLQDVPVHNTRPSPEDLASDAAMEWLASLQNADGGIPTFCRGWGRLPFDRSNPDITAHFLVASRQTLPRVASGRCAERAETFLRSVRQNDGSFIPLWFGNQHQINEFNPTYGTAKVVLALLRTERPECVGVEGYQWLVDAVGRDGGWGADVGLPATIEESALAVDALALVAYQAYAHSAAFRNAALVFGDDRTKANGFQSSSGLWYREYERVFPVLVRGIHWLIEYTARGTSFPPSPIGFYFAKLWYYEKLYPIIFTVAALERAAALLEHEK